MAKSLAAEAGANVEEGTKERAEFEGELANSDGEEVCRPSKGELEVGKLVA